MHTLHVHVYKRSEKIYDVNSGNRNIYMNFCQIWSCCIFITNHHFHSTYVPGICTSNWWMITWASVTPGARNWESFRSSHISPRVPSPLGSLAAESLTVKDTKCHRYIYIESSSHFKGHYIKQNIHLPRVRMVTNDGRLDTRRACSRALLFELSLVYTPLTGPTTDS